MALTTQWAITITGEGLSEASIKEATERVSAQLTAAGAIVGRASYETSRNENLLTVERERAAKQAADLLAHEVAIAVDDERIKAKAAAEVAAQVAARAQDLAVGEAQRFTAAMVEKLEAEKQTEAADLRARLAFVESKLAATKLGGGGD